MTQKFTLDEFEEAPKVIPTKKGNPVLGAASKTLQAVAEPFVRAESIAAGVGREFMQGDFDQMDDVFKKELFRPGLTEGRVGAYEPLEDGQAPQFGDILVESNMPVLSNPVVASSLGFLASLPLGNFVGKGLGAAAKAIDKASDASKTAKAAEVAARAKWPEAFQAMDKSFQEINKFGTKAKENFAELITFLYPKGQNMKENVLRVMDRGAGTIFKEANQSTGRPTEIGRQVISQFDEAFRQAMRNRDDIVRPFRDDTAIKFGTENFRKEALNIGRKMDVLDFAGKPKPGLSSSPDFQARQSYVRLVEQLIEKPLTGKAAKAANSQVTFDRLMQNVSDLDAIIYSGKYLDGSEVGNTIGALRQLRGTMSQALKDRAKGMGTDISPAFDKAAKFMDFKHDTAKFLLKSDQSAESVLRNRKMLDPNTVRGQVLRELETMLPTKFVEDTLDWHTAQAFVPTMPEFFKTLAAVGTMSGTLYHLIQGGANAGTLEQGFSIPGAIAGIGMTSPRALKKGLQGAETVTKVAKNIPGQLAAATSHQTSPRAKKTPSKKSAPQRFTAQDFA